MKKDTDYLQDIEEIRSLMEKSSKFISLSGWAGIFAGVFALLGSYIALTYLDFNPQSLSVDPESNPFQQTQIFSVVQLALLVFLLAISFALFFTHRRAKRKDELLWTPNGKKVGYEYGSASFYRRNPNSSLYFKGFHWICSSFFPFILWTGPFYYQ
jgi:ABC-type multidrug transport system fused ATPase/permease subunit